MEYGGTHWLEEQARNARRVSRFTFASALAVCAVFALGLIPAVGERLWRPESYGFEGTDRYVRRIRLEALGVQEVAGPSAFTVVERESRAGGAERTRSVPARAAGRRPAPSAPGLGGPGLDDADLEARLRALQLDAPVFRSQDLIVERAVNPEYPEDAIVADAEGPVLVLMEVDTTGAVTSVRLLGEAPHPSLERAVVDAALQYRYRPYVRDGAARRVYAAYRFTFRLQ